MEVHAHSHTARKKWTHYFWEFLMLFLAVFCGFLAEYQLEHIIEHQRENAYMHSLAVDVKNDIAILDTAIKTNEWQINGKDSIVLLIESGAIPSDKVEYFYELHWRYLGYPTEVIFSKRTLTQLLNAGGLRLIRNKKVSDAIAEYATGVEYLEKARQQSYIEFSYKALDASQKLIDIQYLRALPTHEFIRAPHEKPVLRNSDPQIIKDFAFTLEMDKENSIIFSNVLRKYKKEAEALLNLLEKEYHIK
jgi:hypothetical protein